MLAVDPLHIIVSDDAVPDGRAVTVAVAVNVDPTQPAALGVTS